MPGLVSLANKLAKLKNFATSKVHSIQDKFKDEWHPEALGLAGTKKPQLTNSDNDPMPPVSTPPISGNGGNGGSGGNPSQINSFPFSNKLKGAFSTLKKVMPGSNKIMNKVKNMANRTKSFKELKNFWESKTKKARKNRKTRKSRTRKSRKSQH